MKSLWITAPGNAEVRDVDDPVPGKGEALLAPLYTGLCGTDLELYTGVMPYLSTGDATYPVLPGHETVARVIRYDDDPTWDGEVVVVDPVEGCGSCSACQSGFATRCTERKELGVRRGMAGAAAELVVVPGRNLHLVPRGMSAREAVLTEPGVTALHAAHRTGAFSAPDALVIGAGTLGLIATAMLVRAGVDVSVAVGDSGRTDLVRALGATPEGSDESTYAVVLETAGTDSAVRRALAAVRAGGHVALTGVQTVAEQVFRPNDLVLHDVTVHGITNGPGLYDDMLARLSGLGGLSDQLVEAVYGLDEFEAAFEDLATVDRARPKVLLRGMATA